MALTQEQINSLKSRYQPDTITQVRKPEDAKTRLARIKSSTVEPKGPGFLERTGKFIADVTTGNTRKFGKTIGESLAAPGNADLYSKSLETHNKIQNDLTLKIAEDKKLNKDTSRLEKALKQHQANTPKLEDFTGDVINKTTGQVLGEGLGTATEMLSGGTLSGFAKGSGVLSKVAKTAEEAKKAKDAYKALSYTQKLGSIGKDSLKMAATTVPFGYAVDVSQGLQGARGEDRTGVNALLPGAGTLISAAIPTVIGGVRAAKATAGEIMPKVLPNISQVPEKVYEQAQKGGVNEFMGKKFTGKGAETPQSVFESARQITKNLKTSTQEKFGKGIDDITKEFTGKRIGLPSKEQSKLVKIAERFGFEDRLPQNLGNMSPKETVDLLSEINAVGPVSQIDDPLVKNLKLSLADIKDVIKTKGVSEFGGEGGKFDKLYSSYSSSQKVLQDMEAVIGKTNKRLNPVQQTTATNRLMSIFNNDKEAYLDAVKALEEASSPASDDITRHLQMAREVMDASPEMVKNDPAGFLKQIKTNIVDGLTHDGLVTEAKKAEEALSKINKIEDVFKIDQLFKANEPRLLDKIAATHLSPILPKGLKGGDAGIIGLTSDALQLAILPLSSPRMSNWLLSKVSGYGPSVIQNIMNSSPVIRQNIYNLVNKQNKTLDEAIAETWSKIEKTPNKQGGFINTKVIADDLRATAASQGANRMKADALRANIKAYKKLKQTPELQALIQKKEKELSLLNSGITNEKDLYDTTKAMGGNTRETPTKVKDIAKSLKDKATMPQIDSFVEEANKK